MTAASLASVKTPVSYAGLNERNIDKVLSLVSQVIGQTWGGVSKLQLDALQRFDVEARGNIDTAYRELKNAWELQNRKSFAPKDLDASLNTYDKKLKELTKQINRAYQMKGKERPD